MVEGSGRRWSYREILDNGGVIRGGGDKLGAEEKRGCDRRARVRSGIM